MIRGAVESVDELEPGNLRAAYDEYLVTAIDAVGHDTAAAETDVDEATLQALERGEEPELTLEEAASVLALDEERPDAETILAEARDILLMGMSQAVLDVEALASGIDGVIEAKELQQKVEGRYTMTLDEYALIHSYIENRKR